jgi:hypothetical protein
VKRIFTALLASMLTFMPVPSTAQPQTNSNMASGRLVSQAGTCPNWGLGSATSGFSGVKWSRSGSRKIYLEWTLSPTNLDGIPVSRRFTADEADQIRAAFSWWDSVFDTIDFREVSGDYAQIKVGAMSKTITARSNYWYFTRSMTFARGQIAMPAASNEAVYPNGKSYNETEVRASLGYLLGLTANTQPNAVAQSKLRQLYREDSCYPVDLGASWDTSNGLSSAKMMAAVGTTQRVKLGYAGLSQVAATVLTPSVCKASNFSVTAQSGVLVNITGQGVCSVLLQAKEGSLPFSSEVLTLRTGFAQKFILSAVPKSLQVGKSFTLKAVSNSGLPVKISSDTASICRVSGAKIIASKVGTCRVRAWANAADFGQLRFLYESQSLSFSVRRK